MSRSRDIADFVAEITDGTDTVETGYVINGSAKAWFNLNYSTSSVTDSLNIASLTDNGTGDHDLNFTNNMGSTNYTLGTCGTSAYNFFVSTVDENSLLTTDVRVQARTGSQNLTDSVIVLGSIHGDLA